MRKPRQYQTDASMTVRTAPCTAVLGPPRIGKTKVAIDGLRTRDRMPQTLILCPVSGQGVWEQELAAEGIANPVVVLSGCFDRKMALLSSAPPDAIVITSYDTLRELFSYATSYFCDYGAVIVDGVTRCGQQCMSMARAMRNVLGQIPKRVILAGALVTGGLLNAWGYDFDGEEQTTEAMRPIPIVVNREILRTLPPSTQRIPFRLSEHPRMVYDYLAEEFTREGTAAGRDPNYVAAMCETLCQVCNGFIKMPFVPKKRRASLTRADMVVIRVLQSKEFHTGTTVMLPTEKVSWFENFLAEAGDDMKTVVWFRHCEAIAHVKHRVPKALVLVDTMSAMARRRALSRFNRASGRAVILVQADAMQSGEHIAPADYVVYYEPMRSREAYQESQGRMRANGHSVQYYELVVAGSIEEVAWHSVKDKISLRDAFFRKELSDHGEIREKV